MAKLTKEEIIDAIFDRLVWEDVVEDIINTLERDITDEEGEFVSNILERLEKLAEDYI